MPKLFGLKYVTFALLVVVTAIALGISWNSNYELKVDASTPIEDSPVNKKVFLLIFNPVIESSDSQKLSTLRGWSDPDAITAQLMVDIQNASHGFVSYTIQERQEIDGFPVKTDNFSYTDQTYLDCLSNTSSCHVPDGVDYQKLFSDYGVCSKNVDEVWLWGAPYFGYQEYYPVMYCGKTQFVMGFSYERQIGEALHDFGHRMEYVSKKRINEDIGVQWKQDESSEWNKFSKIDTGCGNVHNPPGPYDYTFVNPNGSLGRAVQGEYNYSSTAQVSTTCDGYLNYPTGPFPTQSITCSAWNCSQDGFMRWWLGRVPHAVGTSVDPATGKLIYNNWWKYFAYFDETADGAYDPNVTPVPTRTPADLDSHLIGYWGMNEASGSAVQDGSVNGYNGVATGTSIVAGKLGNARRFNGVDDIVSVASNPSFSGMSDFSVSLWVKPEDLNVSDALFCNQTGSAPYSYCLFYIPEFQKISFRVNSNGNDVQSQDNSVLRNVWTHVVASYVGSSGKLSLYLNGVACTSCSGNIASGNVNVTSNNLVFGSRYGSENLTGSLDEIRFYNVALSNSEIASLYVPFAPSPTPTSEPPTPTVTQVPTSIPTIAPSPTPTTIPTSTPTPVPSDTTAPSVSVTSPLNNAFVSRSKTVTIKASASDAAGVSRVEFFVSGVLKCTDTTSPYTCNWAVPSQRSVVYNLTAKAYDPTGNVGTSSVVKVTSR